jgi:galactokinase
LIGEHTDYNEGFVLPSAIDREVVVAAGPRTDGRIAAISLNFGAGIEYVDPSTDIVFSQDVLWVNYLRGVVWTFRQLGHVLSGANIVIASDLPAGVGLASSAAIEVALAGSFAHLNQITLSDISLAKLGRRVENDFVGINSGILDQFVSILGRDGHGILLDCRSLDFEYVPIPAELAIIVINSNVKRQLVNSEYNKRRQECQSALSYFAADSLRDVSLSEFETIKSQMPSVLAKRARHVISENLRTLAFAAALRSADINEIEKQMAASHASLRDDFQVTIPEIDLLVTIVTSIVSGQGGVRMTGGGFGGCVVTLAPERLIPDIARALDYQYESQTGVKPVVYECVAATGLQNARA